MHKILRSFFPTEEHEHAFQRAVNLQIREMELHDAHMRMVKKKPKEYQPHPAPVAHPDIMAAITKDKDGVYNIAYEIVDPVMTLEEKKDALTNSLTAEVGRAIETLLPTRKAPLLEIEMAELGRLEKPDKTQKKRITEINDTFKQVEVVRRHFAEVQSQIHDLTEKDIDSWKLPPLKVK